MQPKTVTRQEMILGLLEGSNLSLTDIKAAVDAVFGGDIKLASIRWYKWALTADNIRRIA